MKKTSFHFLLSLVLLLSSNYLNAQDKVFDSTKTQYRPKKIAGVECNRPPSIICNMIENKAFSTTCFGLDPFGDNCVSKWAD